MPTKVIHDAIRLRRSQRTIFVAIGAVLLLFALFLFAMFKAGFFRFSGTDPSSKVVAAALALAGGFVTSAVSIVGVLLKHSIDQQSEDRLEIEAQRTASLREAEQRLQQEAAIRAVQLLSTDKGAPAPSIQRSGALFALISLGQFDLTISLMGELLERDQLEPTSAAGLFERAFAAVEFAIQNRAINLLVTYAHRLLTPYGVVIPEIFNQWGPNLHPAGPMLATHVIEGIPIALGKMLVARPFKEWTQASAGPILIGLLSGGQMPPGYLKQDRDAILYYALKVFPDQKTISHPLMTISLDRLRGITAPDPHNAGARELCGELQKWAAGVA